MKLLDTNGSNTKLAKNNLAESVRVAGLSLHPNDTICPMRHVAKCAGPCLISSGRGMFDNVRNARQLKTDYLENNRAEFLDQLRRELANFEKLCHKNNARPYVRLNVISDVQYETSAYGSIPQSFPNIKFFDYTKISKRLNNTPANYRLMFSYSKAPDYQKEVNHALTTGVPISAVFFGPMPETFLNRPVFNGDKSDLLNLEKPGHIIGLKYKPARGMGIDPADEIFVIDTRPLIPALMVA
tara:strand:+ start:6497 stop:7219 length:723 start_codon:yes stop_codon:yes gene_type:complete